MIIRNTKLEDLSTVMNIYAYAREFMAKTGNPKQWGATNWPPEDLIKDDIAKQKSYVCEHDGEIIAVFYFNSGLKIDPCYDDITEGSWTGDENYGVVHRIASSGDVKGAGGFCIDWAYEQCGHLRMDTHGDNKVMQKCLEKHGFKKCGIIYVVEDNDPRLAYERL